MSEVLQARAALGVASRRGDKGAIESARRDLAAAKLAAYAEKIINEAPPLTMEQRARISGLLRPTGGASK
ncbi:hypothetical protein [Glutamicibacter arilaitensis]|uniref:hypothetical protein n=1 Tax=Glutamicibacter arilaitensis TaxID=256701 RepID=UPI003F921469